MGLLLKSRALLPAKGFGIGPGDRRSPNHDVRRSEYVIIVSDNVTVRVTCSNAATVTCALFLARRPLDRDRGGPSGAARLNRHYVCRSLRGLLTQQGPDLVGAIL